MKLFLLGFLICSGLLAVEPKGDAAPEGLEEAKRDVEALRIALREKSSDQLIKAFIPDDKKRYGGYEYFYKYMANIAIREELESRGSAAKSALRSNTSNEIRVWEAINGPGDTVGRICKQLLGKLTK
jgi:hypothetical protein